MSTSRIPAAVEALVSIFDAATTATVIDGRWVRVPDGDYLTVGWTPDDEGSSATQDWVGLGNRARNEMIDIPCYIDSFSGDTTTASRRNAAFGVLASCEDAVRADPTLGGVVPQPGWAQIGSYRERIEQVEKGLAVGVVFHVLIQTRI